MINKLISNIRKTNAPIVVGLDPMLNYIPEHIQKKAFAEFGETLEGAAEAIWQYNKGIVDATCDLIPAVKPQIAMYEQFGIPGLIAYKKTVDYCKSKDLVVIGDIKRGDIGSTSAAYAVGHLGQVQVGSRKYAGFGTIVQDFWNLNHSYKSAVHALEYRFFFPHQNIFDGREALGSDLSVADFSDTKEDELIRLLCKKDTAAIDLWFQNFSDWLTQKFRTKNFAFIQIYSLLGRILKFFYELNLDTHDLEAKILYVYNHINEFHNTEELCQWLKDLCHLLCRKLDSSMNDYHQKLCELVISYINEHYTDNTLCLNDIAASANVSPAYLSALFKKNQGISLSDFITSQRISAAARYLTTTTMSLKEISLKCGYANQYYFSTSFKKKMGITPSAYREQHT